ncbi:MAG: hypothetical protein P8080_07810 [Gammaproteobacteria bacterium]
MIHQDHLQSPGANHGSPESELQTDVMRFFALLAICLLALMSVTEEPGPGQTPAEPLAEPPRRVPAARPPRAPPPEATPARPAPAEAAAAAPPVPAESAQPPQPAAPGVSNESVSLRFATAEALMRLETVGEVRIFATSAAGSFRWSQHQRRFVPASLPEALYLMDPATIPASLSAGLERAGGDAADARWGVTLSPAIRRRLSTELAGGARGLWLIDAAGRVVPSEGS